MTLTYLDFLKFIKKHEIKYVKLHFNNLFFYEDSITLSVKQFDEKVYNNGIVHHSTQTKFSDIFDKKIIVKPEFCTFFIDPFTTQNTLTIVSDIIIEDHAIISPRIIAKNLLKHLLTKDKFQQMCFQPTLTFYIFDDFYLKSSDKTSCYKLSYNKEDLENIRSEICTVLNDIGINVASHFTGKLPNICNIQLASIKMQDVKDQLYIAKYIAKNVVMSYGKKLTYMPLPLNNSHPIETSIAFNFSKNIKFPKDIFIKNSIYAFTNPTTNSFKRIALLNEQTPRIISTTDKFDVKFSDSTADPYLAMAAILLMLDCANDKNQITNSKCKCNSLTLSKAIKSLDNDRKFFTKYSNTFSDEFINSYIALKKRELRSHSVAPTPLEIETYFNI